MPPSQLKRLKASLREQGILGPQQSKKQKKQNAQNGANKEKKVHRTVALNGIREQFNPFEYKEPSRKPKFQVTTEHSAKTVLRRPGLQKSQAEQAVCTQFHCAEDQEPHYNLDFHIFLLSTFTVFIYLC
jgi:nucleolar protein 14